VIAANDAQIDPTLKEKELATVQEPVPRPAAIRRQTEGKSKLLPTLPEAFVTATRCTVLVNKLVGLNPLVSRPLVQPPLAHSDSDISKTTNGVLLISDRDCDAA
jgi:hypothetical protein